jgi:hypothetical protein
MKQGYNMETETTTAEMLEMLTLTRCHGSEGEQLFYKNYIAPLEPTTYTDPGGNALAYVVQVGVPACDLSHGILFSSHIDTVHSMTDPVRQDVMFDEQTQLVYKDDKRPLGADDAAGVWLMRRMISAGVPGTYIFHRGEERGGIGSRGMSLHHREFLAQFDIAIAFDRRGTNAIITEQMTGVCASQAFALALGDLLHAAQPEVDLHPDDTGVFTDTANYTDVISECTNISVGYENEHSGDEYLDIDYLRRLTDAFIAVFSDPKVRDKLPAKRDPSVVDYGGGFDTNGWFYRKGSAYNSFAANESGKSNGFTGYEYLEPGDIVNMRFQELVNYVRTAHPEDIADLLMDMATDLDKQYQ